MTVDWEAVYQREQAAGARPGWERTEANPALLSWRGGGAMTPCRILVPCAGRSVEPALLARDGFDVTVLDNAPSAIAAQQAVLPAGAWTVLADLFAWEPAQPFDSIYDQTALCALPPDMLDEYVARLHRWLVPGGRLFALFMQTGRDGGPPFDCPLDRMRALFASHDWLWPEMLEVPVLHSMGLREQPAILTRQP
jgi:SAM-dependent methyltransferase